jgi:putative spermidine/putrescine transport system substrate-binding protein
VARHRSPKLWRLALEQASAREACDMKKRGVGSILAVVALIATACGGSNLPGQGGAGASGGGGGQSITLIDTNSGANFQQYFTKTFVPEAQTDLGITINYVVSSGPETLQRMKAMTQGKGDFDVVFMKDNDLVNWVKSSIGLENLKSHMDAIPNLAKTDVEGEKVVLGTDVNYEGALFWRSQSATIVDTAKIPNPPKSWKELYDRRAEFKGHITMVRPDAKSGGGRGYMYTFFHAFGVPFDAGDMTAVMATPQWKDAAAKFTDLTSYMTNPLPAEPPDMFQLFKEGTAWIGDYAQDYTIWATTQGLVPPTMKAYPMQEGESKSADGHLVVPSNIADDRKPMAYKLIDYMLSDKIQLQLLTQMYQYPGTDAWQRAPSDAFTKIPPFEEARKPLFTVTNSSAFDWFKENGMSLVKQQ